MKFTNKEAAMLAHLVAGGLVVCGVLSLGDMASAERSITAAITAASVVVGNAVVAWKYLHHSTEKQP